MRDRELTTAYQNYVTTQWFQGVMGREATVTQAEEKDLCVTMT